jgi:small-conductance mechanosensitive channel
MTGFSQWVTERLREVLAFGPETQTKVWLSLLVFLVLGLIRFIVLRVAYRRNEDIRYRYQWRKSSQYVTVVIGIILVGRIWIQGIDNLTTYLGLLSAGIAIALHEPLVNLAGWALIMWRRPFEVGDRIEVGGDMGDVIDQRIFRFSLMEIRNWVDADQSTGRVIHIPNGKIFREALANSSKGFQYIWDEIPVLVTFESNWKKAKEILMEVGNKHALHMSTEAESRLKKAANRFMIFYAKLTPTVYTSVKDSGVMLTIRYLCEPRKRRGSQQIIWEEILERFAECDDIDFAYPTQRFYNNAGEGKPQARASLDDVAR